MNQYSKIVKLISTVGQERAFATLTKLGVKIKVDGGLSIFNYNMIDADFSSELVREARGIIIDLYTLEVVCWPFTKFFNQHEQFADDINWSSCRVEDKLDGSICKLYWFNDRWNWATNSMIHAENADVEDPTYTNYLELIMRATNYGDIDFAKLDKNCTYIFEIVDPYMHPIKYESVQLWHIGTRNNITGVESKVYIGIQQPAVYELHSLQEVIDFVNNMNVDEVTQEGVVVVDDAWHRVKIKNTTYLQLHYLKSGIISNKRKIVELLHNDDIDTKQLIERFPMYEAVFSHYVEEEDRLRKELQIYLNYARQTYINFGRDRKQLALAIQNDPWRAFAFPNLENRKTAENVLQDLMNKNFGRYCDLLKDFN